MRKRTRNLLQYSCYESSPRFVHPHSGLYTCRFENFELSPTTIVTCLWKKTEKILSPTTIVTWACLWKKTEKIRKTTLSFCTCTFKIIEDEKRENIFSKSVFRYRHFLAIKYLIIDSFISISTISKTHV